MVSQSNRYHIGEYASLSGHSPPNGGEYLQANVRNNNNVEDNIFKRSENWSERIMIIITSKISSMIVNCENRRTRLPFALSSYRGKKVLNRVDFGHFYIMLIRPGVSIVSA
jgi:hypothetical protein